MQSNSTIMRPLPAAPPSPTQDTEALPTPGPARQSLAAATLIQTANGAKRLDRLVMGDSVMTRSGAFAPITGIEHTHFTARQLHDNPDFAPIRFDPGALPGMPDDDATLVSPDCAIAWSDSPQDSPQDSAHFPARAFSDGGLIRWVIPEDGIHYVRLHFATTQEICIGNLWIELSADDDTLVTLAGHVPKLVQEIRIFRPLRN